MTLTLSIIVPTVNYVLGKKVLVERWVCILIHFSINI
jgi:hypothetical protein